MLCCRVHGRHGTLFPAINGLDRRWLLDRTELPMTLLLLLEGQSFAGTQDHVRVVFGVGARIHLRVHDGREPFYLRPCSVKRANV